MPANDDAPKAPINELSAELTDGLKSCRALVRDYRAKLGAAPTPDDTNQEIVEQLDSGGASSA